MFAAILFVLAAFFFAPGASAAGDCTPDSAWPAHDPVKAAEVLVLTNQHRAGLGLSQLVPTGPTEASAVWKARHMAAYNYISHDDPAPPVARSAADRMAVCGVTGGWGENIALGYTTAQAVFTAWLGSPGHRSNIEYPGFKALGVGVAGTAWAQAFSTETAGLPPPTPAPALCARGGSVERARCQLRQQVLLWRKQGRSWAYIKATAVYKAWRLLGGK